MIFFLTMTLYMPGDEDLVFEEHIHSEHIEDCGWELTKVDTPLDLNVKIHPNPVSNDLYISCESPSDFECTLFNTNGQTVKRGVNLDILRMIHESKFNIDILTLETVGKGDLTNQFVPFFFINPFTFFSKILI